MRVPSSYFRALQIMLLAQLTTEIPALAQTSDNPLGLQPHHITASVQDLDRAIWWYQDMLGFRLVERGSRMNGAMQFAELTLPGFGVALVKNASASPPAAATDNAGPHWIHMVFSAPDPGKTYALLKARGAVVATRDAAGGPIHSFLLHDSEGNELEIVAAEAAPTQ